MDSLEELVLDQVRCTDSQLAGLPALPSLRVLGLSGCGDVGPAILPVLASQARLERLDVSCTNLDWNNLIYVAKLHKLKHLIITGRPMDNRYKNKENTYEKFVKANVLDVLNEMPNLERLSIENTQDDILPGLARLRRLRFLELDYDSGDQGITIEGLKVLGGMPNLERVTLKANGYEIPESNLDEVRKAIPSVPWNTVIDPGPAG